MDDEDIAIELMEGQPLENNEEDFVNELYEKLYGRCQRAKLRREDLIYDMFSCGTRPFWYLPYSHDYACMLRQNGFNPFIILNGKAEAGQVEIYEDEVVQHALETVWEWMIKYGKADTDESQLP